MPSHSAAQARLMSAVAHGWKPPGAKKPPVPVNVAREFNQADAGHKFPSLAKHFKRRK